MKSGERLWSAVGRSVQGASHIRNNKPCQDALLIKKTKLCHIVSVSDGHGSASCPYSDEGAQAAVDAACAVFDAIFRKGDPYQTINANKDIWIPKQIEQHWKNDVTSIHKEKNREEDFNYELYGATLLTVVATSDFVFSLQLGDGDILSMRPNMPSADTSETGVSESADSSHDISLDSHVLVDWVIPPDDNLGPETNSLCQDDCWQYMKTKMIRLAPGEELMFMLSTDGYANSFYNNDGFIKAGADFYKLFKGEGIAYIDDNLEEWLIESTTKGSGDDITLALLV